MLMIVPWDEKKLALSGLKLALDPVAECHTPKESRGCFVGGGLSETLVACDKLAREGSSLASTSLHAFTTKVTGR